MNKKEIHYAWWILVSCCALQAASIGFFAGTVGLFLYPVSISLGTGIGTLAIYATIMNIVKIFMYPVYGKFLGRYNIRVLLSTSVLGLILTVLAMSQFTSVIQFYIAGLLLGLFLPIPMFLAVPVLLNNWFKKRIGFSMGLAMSFSGVGAAIFNAVGGIIISSYGWQIAYICMASAIGIIALPFTLFVIRLHPAEMGLKAYGEDETTDTVCNEDDTTGVPHKVAIKSASFLLVTTFGVLMGLAVAMQPNIPAYASSMGFDTKVGGTVAAVISIGILIGKLFLGFLNDRIGSIKAVGIAVLAGVFGMIFLLIANKAGVTFLVGGSFLFGFAIAMATLQPPLLVREIFGSKDYSSIFALVLMGFTLSSAVAMPLYGFVYDMLNSYVPVLNLVYVFYIVSFVICVWAFKYSKRIWS